MLEFGRGHAVKQLLRAQSHLCTRVAGTCAQQPSNDT